MADFGIRIYDPATGAILLDINESTVKDIGSYVASANGTIDASALPIQSTSVLIVENISAPAAPPKITLNTGTKQIAVEDGSAFNSRIRVVDLL